MEKCILLFFLTFMSTVASAPIGNDADATIINYEYHSDEDGYFFTYTTSNGIQRQENAVLISDRNAKDKDAQILRINGFYSYTDEANKVHRVEYVADQNGYQVLRKLPPGVTGGLSFGQSSETYKPEEQKGISSAALASLSGS